MTDVQDNDMEEIECLEDEDSEDCMEFQIGLMIEPGTQEISIVSQNGDKKLCDLTVAPITNNKKRRLGSEKYNSSRNSTSPYTSENSSRPLKTLKAKSSNETLDTATILGAIDNLRKLMTQIAARTDQLYEDFQEIKNKHNTWQENTILDRTFLDIPFGTKEELIAYEEKIKTDDIPRKLLKKFLLKGDDRSWERFISGCLTSCFKKELAVLCSFYGKNNNIEMQHLEIIKVIKECVEEKFSTVRTADINQAIMKWFHLATDRYRRLIVKEKLCE